MTDFRTAPAKLGPLAALFDTEHITPETILSSPGPLAALFDTEHIIPETILSNPGPLAALFDTEHIIPETILSSQTIPRVTTKFTTHKTCGGTQS